MSKLEIVTKVLKIFDEVPEEYINRAKKHFLSIKNLTNVEIEDKILLRKKAKEEGNYSLGDTIRQELKNLGVELHDSSIGTSWDIF